MIPNPQSFSECSLCRQGQLIVVKELTYGSLLVICDDCESEWSNPESAIKGAPPLDDGEGLVEDATVDDIRSKKWDKYFKHMA